jgi:nitrate/nitrite transport system substrate-binding protein
VRDKLVNGEIDASHVLYGLIYGVQNGIGGPKKDMAVLMNLNHNGQAFTLSKKLNDKGVTDGASLNKLIKSEKGEYTFAQTFPTGTHAMWIYYWLAAHGIHPVPGREGDRRAAAADGGQHARRQHGRLLRRRAVELPRRSWTRSASPRTPRRTSGRTIRRRTLGCTAEFVEKYPEHARAMTAACIDAGRWIDASLVNRQKTAEVVADKSYVNTDKDVIVARMLGRYDNGIGKVWDDPNYMKFYNDGYVTFPFLSDGMWFMTQHRRWGLLKEDPDYLAVAKKVNRIDLYKDAAVMTKDAAAEGAVPHREADGRRKCGMARTPSSTPAHSRSGSPRCRAPSCARK